MAVKDQRQLTLGEPTQRRGRDREHARQTVDTLRSSQGWKAWLTTPAPASTATAPISRACCVFDDAGSGYLRQRHVVEANSSTTFGTDVAALDRGQAVRAAVSAVELVSSSPAGRAPPRHSARFRS
jgi:hypothetical protein